MAFVSFIKRGGAAPVGRLMASMSGVQGLRWLVGDVGRLV
jgi:hypothetical protein